MVSSSFVVGDCIHDAWLRDMEADLRTPATYPVRQNIFITVALDALLTYHPENYLRDLVIDACHRRLVRLGLVAPSPEGATIANDIEQLSMSFLSEVSEDVSRNADINRILRLKEVRNKTGLGRSISIVG